MLMFLHVFSKRVRKETDLPVRGDGVMDLSKGQKADFSLR